MALIEKLENIGDAIRSKTGKTDLLTLDEMATEIGSIETGGSAVFEINDCSYLLYNGSRLEILNDILPLCKNVTNTSNMFYGCQDLTELSLTDFDTSKVTNTSNMFGGCRELVTLNVDNFDTKNVKTINQMFSNCRSLITLNLSSFDLSMATSITSILYNCSGLKNLSFAQNVGKGFTQKSSNYSNYNLDLSRSTSLTYDSLMSVINNLYDLNLTYDVANGGTLYTQSLTIGSTNTAKLTAEEIAIATNKGWTVA